MDRVNDARSARDQEMGAELLRLGRHSSSSSSSSALPLIARPTARAPHRPRIVAKPPVTIDYGTQRTIRMGFTLVDMSRSQPHLTRVQRYRQWLSLLCTSAQGSRGYAHVELCFEDGMTCSIYYGAKVHFHLRRYVSSETREFRLFERAVSPRQYGALYERCRQARDDEIGFNYAAFYFNFWLPGLCCFCFGGVNRYGEALICSELVTLFLRDVGAWDAEETSVEPHSISPEEVYAVCEASPAWRLVPLDVHNTAYAASVERVERSRAMQRRRRGDDIVLSVMPPPPRPSRVPGFYNV